jgi:hypothetical protein
MDVIVAQLARFVEQMFVSALDHVSLDHVSLDHVSLDHVSPRPRQPSTTSALDHVSLDHVSPRPTTTAADRLTRERIGRKEMRRPGGFIHECIKKLGWIPRALQPPASWRGMCRGATSRTQLNLLEYSARSQGG